MTGKHTILTERVHLRIIRCPACQNIRCHVSSRLPNYCCECGTPMFATVRGLIHFDDDNALLKYKEPAP